MTSAATKRIPLRALIVEDREEDAELLLIELKRGGFDVASRRVETAAEMADALEKESWDIVLSDYSMPAFDALAAVTLLKSTRLDLPLIVISGTIGEETAVAALMAGARDFIVKGRLARLVPAVERELRDAKSRAILRKTEEQLRHAQKMEAVGRLAGGVAHDFNNVLSVITLYGELITENLRPGDPLLDDMREIKNAALRATDLTRQLLAFTRQQVMHPTVIDVRDAIFGMQKMLQRLIGEDIELRTLFGNSLGKIEVDPGQLEQVIMNLVLNARDAMVDGGKLTLEVENVTLDQDYAASHVGVTPGPYVLIAMTDTGTGMDRETQAKIFEPFFTTKERGHGTGLGLATVDGIVKQSGGHIWVYSELGVGTTFKIYLPRTDRPKAATTQAPALTSCRGNETILLIEDDDGVRVAIGLILKKYGYHVLEAASGGDALLICEQHTATIHLLLTDVVMPRMNGRQVSERLRPLRPTMRVLFMSGYANGSVVHHGVIESDVAFLQKPVTPEALVRAVREILDLAPTKP